MRYLTPFLQRDLTHKMVFVGGPRQVGKTTLAKAILAQHRAGGCYLNWDHDEDRQRILHKKWLRSDHLLVFDELHKYPQWKQWLKGLYDTQADHHAILVTGSARLDLYRQGGDSLMGRYHYWRLHPMTLDEAPVENREALLSQLLTLGGFPEPLLQNDLREAKRWRRERFDRVLFEDIRDLEPIRNLQSLRLLTDLLRQRVGSLVVMSHLASDLQVAPQTVKSWIAALEHMYLLFLVSPYTRKISRAVQKPPKIYFYDNADVVGDEGARFENLVASHLLKWLQFREDYEGDRCQLHYLRDKEGREVDFVVEVNGEVEELIEVKWADAVPSRSLKYYQRQLQPLRTTQIVARLGYAYEQDGVRVLPVADYFSASPWNPPPSPSSTSAGNAA